MAQKKILEYIEAIANACPHALTPLEELELLGLSPCETYLSLFRASAKEEEFPEMSADECRIFEDEDEYYKEYSAGMLKESPLLEAITRYNCNRRIYEA